MKKLVLLVMVLLLAVPAVSQMSCPSDPGGCNVSFDVNVEKDKKICDLTLNAKLFFTLAVTCLEPDALADCEVFKCDLNAYNYVNLYASKFEDSICGSFNNFEGIGQANQAAGYAVNQGNVVAIAATEGTKKSAAMTEVGVEQTNTGNMLYSDPYCFFAGTESVAKIDNSFNRFDGIGQANQSPGSMNNQNNVVAVSAGLETGVLATNDTFLTQNNVFNCANVSFATNSNLITGSFNGFTGIGQTNQSSGSMNNQANIVSVSFAGNRR